MAENYRTPSAFEQAEAAAPIFGSELWWEKDDEHIGAAVAAIGRKLWDEDEVRREDFDRNMRRFSARSITGLFQGRDLLTESQRDNVRVNITKAMVETLTAKVGGNRPRPKLLTDGADWSLQQRVKKLQKFLDGVYQTAEVYRVAPLVFRDALLGGTGITYFYHDIGGRRVGLERVFPLEIVVDPLESVNGYPQSLFRIRYFDKGVLKRMLPKKAREIEEAGGVDYRDLPAYVRSDGRTQRMVQVVEGWHLGGFDLDGNLVPGKHVIGVAGHTLAVEDYEHDTFPFEFFHWTAPMRGFWGDSAAGEVRGLERECNRLLQHIQRSMRLCGNPVWMVPTGTNIKASKMSNEIGQIVKFDGPQAPEVKAFTSVDPQMLAHAWSLYGRAFQIVGTNELQASGTKPPGIDSGRGLEQLSEEHLVRFKTVSKDFEDMVGCRYAVQLVRQARMLDKALRDRGVKGGYTLRAPNNKTMLKLAWEDCAIGDEDFFIQTWPTSVLPITPAGKTQEVERWQANGWLTPERAQELLEFPDLDSEANLTKADSDLLEYQLAQMLEDGKDVLPDPRQDLGKALARGTYALEHGMIVGAPSDNLDKVRSFLNACEDYQAMAAAAAAAPPPPDGAGTVAGPAGPMAPTVLPQGAQVM